MNYKNELHSNVLCESLDKHCRYAEMSNILTLQITGVLKSKSVLA